MGDAVAVVESMKLETLVTAGTAGRVRDVLVSANVQVPSGAILVRLDPDSYADTDTAVASEDRASAARLVPPLQRTPAERCDANLLTLSNLLWGTTSIAADALAAVDDQADVCVALEPDPDLLQREIALVTLFSDLPRAVPEPSPRRRAGSPVRSPEEHFFAYLRSLDTDREGLPAQFVADLRRAARALRRRIAHAEPDAAGRPLLDLPVAAAGRGPAAGRRLGARAVAARRSDSPTATGDDALRECLDHLIAATVHRHPVIADLAREVRFHALRRACAGTCSAGRARPDGAAPRRARPRRR